MGNARFRGSDDHHLAAAGRRAGEVLVAYGACLAARSSFCASATILPFPPEEIRAAIKLHLPLAPPPQRVALRAGYGELETFLAGHEWDIVRDVSLAYVEGGVEAFAAGDDRGGAVSAILARMAARRLARIREILAYEDGVYGPTTSPTAGPR